MVGTFEIDFLESDELEALLREKDKALSSYNAEASRLTAPQFSSHTQVPTPPSSVQMGILPTFGPSPAVSPDVDLFPGSRVGDDQGGMDFSPFQGNSLDNLAGVASMLGTSSLDSQFGPTATDINRNSMNGLSARYTPPTGNHDLVFLAWPQNLPNQEVTHHL